MNPPGRSERLYLSDARDAIDRVLSYTSGGRDRFFDEAIVYFQVDLNIARDVIQNDLAPLREALVALLAD